MARWMLCSPPHPQIHLQASQACQVHQGIQAEFIDATAQQVVEPGLGDTKLSGFLTLGAGLTFYTLLRTWLSALCLVRDRSCSLAT